MTSKDELNLTELAKEFGIEIAIPLPNDPEYVKTIIQLYEANDDKHFQLATFMVIKLTDYCALESNFERLYQLASYLYIKITEDGRGSDLDEVAGELRCIMFGLFIANQHDGELLKHASKLLSVITDVDLKFIWYSDLSLYHSIVKYSKVKKRKIRL